MRDPARLHRRHPDLRRPTESALVLDSTERLVERLAGQGSGLDISTVTRSLGRFDTMWPALPTLPDALLPRWCKELAGEMSWRHRLLIADADGEYLVHYDIRNDNMLLREDGSLVFVDWGMARVGGPWMDPLVARFEWVEQPVFDDLVHGSPHLTEFGDDHVTTFLFAFGAWMAYRTTVAVDTGLPTLDEFRRAESARLLEGARRRLGR